MPKVSLMQGTPAHIEYLKADGKRRHPASCIFKEGKGNARICTNPHSELYNRRCRTAKNCEYYEEKTCK